MALNGDNQHWGGYSHIKNQVGNISELLSNASSKVSTYFNDNDTLTTLMETMKRENIDIYNKNKDSEVTTPNPTTTAASPSGSPLPTVESYFIENYLGPNGTANTMVDDIHNQLLNTQKVNLI